MDKPSADEGSASLNPADCEGEDSMDVSLTGEDKSQSSPVSRETTPHKRTRLTNSKRILTR